MPTKYRYEELTWPEIREAAAQNRVAVLPIGTIEQHGPHLPLATDVITASEISRRAAERIPTEAILLPVVHYSYNENHMDFPGTIAIEGRHLIDYVTDVATSLARHGFRKILLVNGHGGNIPFLDVAARGVTLQTESLCALVSWWSLIPRDLLRAVRESERPGGMLHACELETSAILHLRPDLVQFEKARKEIGFDRSEFFSWDLEGGSPVVFQEWFSRFSETGTVGDPTKATGEKGRKFIEAAVERLVSLLQDFRAREIRPRVDHH